MVSKLISYLLQDGEIINTKKLVSVVPLSADALNGQNGQIIIHRDVEVHTELIFYLANLGNTIYITFEIDYVVINEQNELLIANWMNDNIDQITISPRIMQYSKGSTGEEPK